MKAKAKAKSKRPGKSEAGLVEVTGFVEKLFYSKPNFSAGRLSTSDGDKISFSGAVYFNVNDFVTLRGVYEQNDKWGLQLKATDFEYAAAGNDAVMDIEGLAHYLAVCPDFKGLGKVKAAILAHEYGDRFGSALEQEPEAMAKHAKIKLDRILAIRDAWRSNSRRNATSAWLGQFELTANQINKIIDALGNNARKSLEEDPYILIDLVDGFGFATVDTIALRMGISKEHPGRMRAGIIYAVSKESEEGHTWSPRAALIEKANELLYLDSIDSMKKIEARLDEILLEEKPYISEDDSKRISVASIAKMEADIFGWLKAVYTGSAGKEFSLETDELTEDQDAAVRGVMENTVSAVTGGAGVGKTFSIAAIIREFLCRGERKILLCAPTGKAAQRITESLVDHEIEAWSQSVDLPSKTTLDNFFNPLEGKKQGSLDFLIGQTIHRMLGFAGEGSWLYDSSNQLDADLVIVDEASMIPINLLWRLMSAINLNRTHLVFVGDPNQLPPIGAGNPLRDIIRHRLAPVYELRQVMRQAGELKENCSALLTGRVAASRKATINKDGIQDFQAWYVVESNKLNEQTACQEMIVKLFSERIEKLVLKSGKAPDLIRDVQLITPTHKGDLGTLALNTKLQAVIQKKLYGVDVAPVAEGRKPPFMVGDKVIQTKNDYKIGVMNGTLGIIEGIASYNDDFLKIKKGDLSVLFDGKTEPVSLTGDMKSNVALAYALTIHKCQGSEFPISISIIHKAHSFQQHRAMIYTAATRARQIAVIVGDPWGIRMAAEKVVLDKRRTLMDAWSLDKQKEVE